MSNATLIIGLAGIISTAGVGVASPALASHFADKQQRATFEHERAMRDSDDLRLVLDEAAVHLERVADMLENVSIEARLHNDSRDQREALKEIRELLRSVVARMAVRLGEHDPLTRKASLAYQAVGGVIGGAGIAQLQHNDERWLGLIDRGQEQFKEAQKGFIEEASSRAGLLLSAK